MRFHIRYAPAVRKFLVLDRHGGNEAIGVHNHLDDAVAHAHAEEKVWRKHRQARQLARVYQHHQARQSRMR